MNAGSPEVTREAFPVGRALRARHGCHLMFAAGSESPPYRAA